MTWGALLQTVGKGVAKKVSGAAKKKGSEMAKKIVNKKEESKQSAIVVREKSTALIPISKADGEEDGTMEKDEAPLSMLLPTWVLMIAAIYFGLSTDITVGAAKAAAVALMGDAGLAVLGGMP